MKKHGSKLLSLLCAMTLVLSACTPKTPGAHPPPGNTPPGNQPPHPHP